MALLPHQHRALVAELRKYVPGWQELDTDVAFAIMQTTLWLKYLGTYHFITQSKLDKLPTKRRPDPERTVIVMEEEIEAFPTGIPGFPNKLRREWFDSAWAEVRG